MSLIDDVLITVEDREKIAVSELHNLLQPETKQAVFSAVGRLIKKDFLKNSPGGVTITQKGKDYVYGNLNAIKKFGELKRPFTLVIFEIPENQKVTREKLRTQLNNLGFGSLKRGIMMGAVSDEKEILRIINTLNLRDRVLILRVSSANEVLRSRFIPWNFEKINLVYHSFIERASQFLSQQHDEKTRIRAKQLVLHFARASKLDPVLPSELNDHHYLGYRAHELYLKLKPLCY